MRASGQESRRCSEASRASERDLPDGKTDSAWTEGVYCTWGGQRGYIARWVYKGGISVEGDVVYMVIPIGHTYHKFWLSGSGGSWIVSGGGWSNSLMPAVVMLVNYKIKIPSVRCIWE